MKGPARKHTTLQAGMQAPARQHTALARKRSREACSTSIQHKRQQGSTLRWQGTRARNNSKEAYDTARAAHLLAHTAHARKATHWGARANKLQGRQTIALRHQLNPNPKPYTQTCSKCARRSRSNTAASRATCTCASCVLVARSCAHAHARVPPNRHALDFSCCCGQRSGGAMRPLSQPPRRTDSIYTEHILSMRPLSQPPEAACRRSRLQIRLLGGRCPALQHAAAYAEQALLDRSACTWLCSQATCAEAD